MEYSIMNPLLHLFNDESPPLASYLSVASYLNSLIIALVKDELRGAPLCTS